MGALNDPKHTGFIYYQNTFYREQDNLVSSTYYHLKEFSDVVTENDYIKRTKEQKNKRTRGAGRLALLFLACGIAEGKDTHLLLFTYEEQAIAMG
ncbi:hypothetical protein [Brevibacillus halotolerans]|uniref:hypothetical protein n=1 Tax=Brevibacillus halotolerans TaxID=1507437 RepID=UPI0015EEEC51|nr:hypothetical protein [Brevibacillus halotolerans]MBA4532153.1 hypothetical protein [Brevibacillus halotolerans]